MSDSGPIEETIFMQARQLACPEARAAYLDGACGKDGALRGAVERMLKAEQKADQFLASDPLRMEDNSCEPAGGAEIIGSTIGPYKILQQIGEGGCGIVYMAEQQQPIRRRVALKIIKPGMDSRQVIARFEAERQALAMMDHPNIARVFDGGTTEAGRPYFVMELVRGTRITDFCDQTKLSTRERLELFTKLVHAVHHAHQKGVIHRDLKPSNVLITLHDGVPVPKVIDFGIAKALEQKLTDKTLFTQFEQFLGTPAYTSPEQAEMSALDIDTRSDIYSLGVILYELLVGKTPFDVRELMNSGLAHMRRIIREQEPTQPSTRVTTMPQGEVTTTAQHRRVSVPELVHLLKGDLDWIVMKCLEKDRTRRYDTANGLSSDIERYLGNEPVTARPPSRLYWFGKLIRRNRVAFAAAAAVVLALVVGTVVSIVQMAHARRAEQASNLERETTAVVLQFVRDKVLAAGRPEGIDGGLGRDVTLRVALDSAETQIADSFTNQPLAEAAIRKTFGESYRHLGEPALAVKQLERSFALRRQVLGLDHWKTLDTLNTLSDSYLAAGQPYRSVSLHEEAVSLLKARRGAEHPDTLSIMFRLAAWTANAGDMEKALALYEETLKLQQAALGQEHPQTLHTLHNLARSYAAVGDVERGLALLQETLKARRMKLGADHVLTLAGMNDLAEALSDAGKHDQALALWEEAFRILTAKKGPLNSETLRAMVRRAGAYADAGRFDQALALHEETIGLSREKLGPDHPQTLTMLKELALTYYRAGDGEHALPLYEQVLKLGRARLGPDHPLALDALHDVAVVHWDAGRVELALPLLEEATRLRKAKLGLKHPKTLWEMNRLARAYVSAGRIEQALTLFEDTLGLRRVSLRDGHPDIEETIADLAELRYRERQYAEAEPLYREMLRIQSARLGAGHQTLLGTRASLARLLADWSWTELKRPTRLQSRSNTVDAVAPNSATAGFPARGTTAMDSCAPCERAREAERLLRQCLLGHLNGTNQTHWRVGDVRSRLGSALVSLVASDPGLPAAARTDKLAEAETLLLAGHQRLQESHSAGKKYKRDALERLVRLYDEWGRLDPLAEWQQKLDAFDKANAESSVRGSQPNR